MRTRLHKTRQSFAILLFLAIAVTGWFMLNEGAYQASQDPATANAALDLGYQHSQRLQIAAARATADALGMKTGEAASYKADYRLQQMQIQADSEGLDRWAAHDARHQGLLQAIRASLAALRVALDQTAGTTASAASPIHIPLLPALSRAESDLSNYSASVLQAQPTRGSQILPKENLRRWPLGMLFLVELACLAWLFFSSFGARKNASPL